MDTDLARELAAFSPRWQAPHRRLPSSPDLPWLTILLDETRAEPGAQTDWARDAARGAAGLLRGMDIQPGPLEIWLEGSTTVAAGAQGVSGAFDDGVARIALSAPALPFSVAHEVAHFVTTSAVPPTGRHQGNERVAIILLEEYLAQQVGIALLGGLAIDVPRALAHESHSQSWQVVREYRAVRDAFRRLIEGGAVPADLLACIFTFTRALAYLAGTRLPVNWPQELPEGLGYVFTQSLCPALARISVPEDLRVNRLALATRLDLMVIVSDLLSEVISNALVATPRVRRHPDWPAAFGRSP